MNNTHILGCFVSIEAASTTEIDQKIADDNGKVFNQYVWGEKGIKSKLIQLKSENYGNDLDLILLQFYVNPSAFYRQHLKEIESYRKKEKAIGIPIIVNDDNFFSQSEEGRHLFLKQSIIQKMDLLENVVKRRKLDTNMKQLKVDLKKVLSIS